MSLSSTNIHINDSSYLEKINDKFSELFEQNTITENANIKKFLTMVRDHHSTLCNERDSNLATIAVMKGTIQQLNNQLVELKTKLQLKINDSDALQQIVGNQNNEKVAIQKQIDNIRRDQAKNEADIQQYYQKQQFQFKQTIEEQQATISQQKVKYEQLNDQIGQFKQQIEALKQSNVQQVQQTQLKYQQENEILMQQLNKQRDEINNIKQTINEQQNTAKMNQIKIIEQNDQIKTVIARNQDQIRQQQLLHSKEIESLNLEKNLIITNLSQELNSIKLNYESERHSSYQDLDQTKSKLDLTLKSLNYRTVQCNELANQRHDLEQQVKHITLINQQNEKRLESLDRDDKQQQIDQLQKVIAKLQSKKLQSEVANAKEENASKNSEEINEQQCLSPSQQLPSLRRSSLSPSQQLTINQNDPHRILRLENESLKAEIDKLRKQVYYYTCGSIMKPVKYGTEK